MPSAPLAGCGRNVAVVSTLKYYWCHHEDSAHFKNEQRKQAQTEERIARLKKQAAGLTQGQLAGHQRCVVYLAR